MTNAEFGTADILQAIVSLLVPIFSLTIYEGVFRYEIFSSFYAPLDSPVYGLSFNQTETKEKLLKYSKENSEIILLSSSLNFVCNFQNSFQLVTISLIIQHIEYKCKEILKQI